MDKPNELELAVLTKLFAGDSPALVALRGQIQLASVQRRKFTGVGFFTTFELPVGIAPAPVRIGRIVFGDVEAKIAGLEHGAGFLVYVEDGKLHRLEGFTYDEPWPDQGDQFELRYREPSRQSELRILEST